MIFDKPEERCLVKLRQQNLLLGAAATSLEVAARAWGHVVFGNGAWRHCQLCHQRIRRWSQIRCASTGVELVIGLNCHDALAAFRETGLWPVAEIRRQYQAAREFARREITASIVGFLRASELTGHLREAFGFLEQHGHPRSVEEAAALLSIWQQAENLRQEEERRALLRTRWIRCPNCKGTDRLKKTIHGLMLEGHALSHTCPHCAHVLSIT